MSEKKLDEILDLIKQMEQRRIEDNKKIEERFNLMELRRIEDNKKIEEKFNQMELRRIEDNKKIVEKFNQIEQKRIDDNFYFEHTYWDKISIIFEKLQLNDDLKNIENKEKLRLQKQVDSNSAQIMMHDSRILKLEQSANF